MTLFQKHVRFQNGDPGCKRNFTFGLYGDKDMAVMAATFFESNVKSILSAFDLASRKPLERREILSTHGVEESFVRKSIAKQREDLVHILCAGRSKAVEDNIINSMCKAIHDEHLLGKASVHHSTSGFTATFAGTQQKLEQTFKSLKAASNWIVQMEKADKDTV